MQSSRYLSYGQHQQENIMLLNGGKKKSTSSFKAYILILCMQFNPKNYTFSWRYPFSFQNTHSCSTWLVIPERSSTWYQKGSALTSGMFHCIWATSCWTWTWWSVCASCRWDEDQSGAPPPKARTCPLSATSARWPQPLPTQSQKSSQDEECGS